MKKLFIAVFMVASIAASAQTEPAKKSEPKKECVKSKECVKPAGSCCAAPASKAKMLSTPKKTTVTKG